MNKYEKITWYYNGVLCLSSANLYKIFKIATNKKKTLFNLIGK